MRILLLFLLIAPLLASYEKYFFNGTLNLVNVSAPQWKVPFWGWIGVSPSRNYSSYVMGFYLNDGVNPVNFSSVPLLEDLGEMTPYTTISQMFGLSLKM